MVESYSHIVGKELFPGYGEVHRAIGRYAQDHSQILHVELRHIFGDRDTIRIVQLGACVH